MNIDFTEANIKTNFRQQIEKEMERKMFDVADDDTTKQEIRSRSGHAVYVACRVLEDVLEKYYPKGK